MLIDNINKEYYFEKDNICFAGNGGGIYADYNVCACRLFNHTRAKG